MNKKIDALIDAKMVVSVALGIVLAGVIAWALGAVLMVLGLGHRDGWDKDGGTHKKMMNNDSKIMQGDMNNSMYANPADTFEAGSNIPTGIDAAAM